MPLPAAASPEQSKKREAAAQKNPGPAPEKSFVLPEKALKPQAETTKPASSGAEKSGEAGPGGKVDAGPIPAAVRSKMEKSFGQDLSKVVVHSGPGVDTMCQKRGAVAFAQGQAIYMSAGAGDVGSAAYNEVLGHELTHVLQQQPKKPDAPAGSAPEAKKAEPGGKTNPDKKETKEPPKGAAKSGDAEQKDPAAAAAPGGAAPTSGSALEAEAAKGGQAAAAGQPVPVQGAASPGSEQHAPAADEHKNPNTLKIPIGKDRNIEIVPPNRDGDWSVGVGDLKKFSEGVSAKDSKWWRKSFPTPFFGLSCDLGAFVGYEFKVGEVSLKGLKVNYKKASNTYELEAEAGTGMSLEVNGGFTAGVSADVWVASAGIGLKAKISLIKNHPLSVGIKGSWNRSTNQVDFGAKLALAALELEAKAAVGLYVYYDAIGVSTYTKEWTLWERTLGKLAFAGFELEVGRFGGRWKCEPKPKPMEMQDIVGNVKNMYPGKS